MSGKVTHGADVEELDDIAVGLRRQGSKVADVGDRGAAHLEKLRALWDGPDFEKFANAWRVAHRAIDDAESALRTYSRQLAAESEQQRRSSGVSSAEFVGAPVPGGAGPGGAGPGGAGHGGVGPAFVRGTPGGSAGPGTPGVVEGEFVERPREGFTRDDVVGEPARAEGGLAFERVESGAAAERPDDQHAAESVDSGQAFERAADQQGSLEPRVGSLEQLPNGLTGLVIDAPLGPMLLASPHGSLIADNTMAVMPDLPGAEEIGTEGPQAFERLDGAGAVPEATASPGGDSPSSEAPVQVATGEGAHVTTGADSAGQRSVAFDPRGVMSEAGVVDGASIGGWLGLDDLDLLPWRT